LQAQGFNLIVLDLGLPDVDGLELLRRFRRLKVPSPIIILTARYCGGVNDTVTGINQGGDDYMTKPFELRELDVRIGGFNRRRQERRTLGMDQ
jgi:two-component system OmpR family response regulator